jgi:hypothetical protein
MSACNCCELFPTFSGSSLSQPYVLKLEARSKGFSAAPFYFQDENGDYFKTITQTDTWVGGPSTILYVDVSDQSLDYYGEIDFGSTTESTYTYAWINCQDVLESASGFYFDERADSQVTTQYSDPFDWPSEAVTNVEECLTSSSFGEWAFAGFVEASKILTEIGSLKTYAATVSEYRFKHPPTATGYLKVWLSMVEETYSSEGELLSSSTEPFTTYEWSGTPPSLNHSINSLENLITSEVFEATPPESHSVVRKIFISKWSMLPEYEPDDPVSVDLLFAPYSHTRPDPDCLSNAVPTLNEDCPPPEE